MAQVFAPPDIDVVCFEPMTAPANALRTGEGLPFAYPGAPYGPPSALRCAETFTMLGRLSVCHGSRPETETDTRARLP